MTKEFSTENVLALSCAVQRVYGKYQKNTDYIYEDGKFLYVKPSNKDLIRYHLGAIAEPDTHYDNVVVEQQDHDEAEKIKKFFRRLMFNVITTKNEFETEINSLLESNVTPYNKLGFIACLPSVYEREYNKNNTKKLINNCDNAALGPIGTTIFDRDCEILSVRKNTTFEGLNVLAIIDNKIVSWFSSKDVKIGPAVIIKAKIKNHSENFQTKKTETRLNYVKVQQ